MKGGVVQLEIEWNCDLDYSVDLCLPKFSFDRYDLKFGSKGTPASGFNFRFAEKYFRNNQKYRLLVKAYGIRIFIVVTGKAGKFDFIPLFLTVGAGSFILIMVRYKFIIKF